MSESANQEGHPSGSPKTPEVSPEAPRPASFKWLIWLIALFSICVTSLIVVGQLRQRMSGNEMPEGFNVQTPPANSATPIDLSSFQPISDFKLTDHKGDVFHSSSLKGKWWVASFIFTRCPHICPKLTRDKVAMRDELLGRMHKANLAEAFSRLEYISFSVDPETDTPEKLSAFAIKQGAHTKGAEAGKDNGLGPWYFLTGSKQRIWELCQKDFHLPVADSPDVSQIITHSKRIVLVDPAGKIRGYYDPELAESKNALFDFLEVAFKQPA